MAGLPPRPVDKSPPREDDRRYSPTDRERYPVRPMVRPRHRDDRFAEDDRVYLPRPHPRVEYDSYVAPQHGSQREDDIRRPESERDRRERSQHYARSRDYRDSREWDRRKPWIDRERSDRHWDRGSRTWEPDADYDRHRRHTYDKEQGYERRRGDASSYDRSRDYPEYSRRDSRPPSPSRRTYDSPHEYSFRRASRSPRRRQPSPVTSYNARRSSRPRSPPSPQHKQRTLDTHAITNSPRSKSSPHSQSRSSPTPNHDQSKLEPHSSRSRDRRSASPRYIPPHEPVPVAPNTATRNEYPEPGPAKIEDETSLSTSLHVSQTAAAAATSASRSRTPDIKSEPPDAPVPQELSREDKGKLKEEPMKDVGGDVKMRESSRSPPRHPRYRGDASIRGGIYNRRASRSPPRGPRNHARTPTGPSSPAPFHPPLPRGPRRHITASAPISNPTPPNPSPAEAPPVAAPETRPKTPEIPAYKPIKLPSEIGDEISRLKPHRGHLMSEYANISKASRRALHELDIATIDLRAAESRRKMADAQMEKARAGVLGIDAVQVDTQ